MKTLTFARLLLAHDRASLLRLLGIACGVAVGTALFLTLWGFAQGITTRTERETWANYPVDGVLATEWSGELPNDRIIIAGCSTVSYSTLTDHFMGQKIATVTIAATPNSTVAVPGVECVPEPGSYLASPAAAELIASYPAELLGDRYGKPAGIIGDDALGSPSSLLIIQSMDIEKMCLWPDAMVVSNLAGQAFSTNSFQIAAIVGSVAVLMPVLLLISIITRLGSAQRSEMFATLRLIGATPAQIARLSVLETGATSLAGALAGALLAWTSSPLFAAIQIDGERFFPADIQPSLPFALAIALLITAATALVAWFRALRSQSTGLGTSQQLAERRPGLWRLVPLLLGMVGLTGGGYLSSKFDASSAITELLFNVLFIGGFIAILLGLVLAGPLLTWWASRLALHVSRGAVGVIAFARIREHPQATFRAVGGLVVAVFVVSFFFAAITSVAADAKPNDPEQSANAPASTSTAPAIKLLQAGLAGDYTIAEMDATQKQLAAVPGVTGTATIYYHETSDGEQAVLRAEDLTVLGIPKSDVPDAPWVEVHGSYLPNIFQPVGNETPAELIRPAQINDSEELRPSYLLVTCDSSPLVLERVRTAMFTLPLRFYMAPQSTAEMRDNSSTSSFTREYAYLANLGVLIATLISGISMAVSTVSGILDRRRTLALTRLMGMPHTAIRRMIVFETLLPLLTVFLLSVALGFVVAQLLLVGLTDGRRFVVLSLIDPTYFAVLAISLLLASVAIIATFPTARRSTALTATRFE
jgi:cell division protein FtsX